MAGWMTGADILISAAPASISKTNLGTQDPICVLGSAFPTPESAHHLDRGESQYPFPHDVFPAMRILINPLGPLPRAGDLGDCPPEFGIRG